MNNVYKHSGLGVTSFVLSLISLLGTIIFVIAAIKIIQVELPHNATIIISLVILSTLLLSLIGLILGILGVCKKDRKKLISILGLVINLLIFAFIMVLMLLGHFSSV